MKKNDDDTDKKVKEMISQHQGIENNLFPLRIDSHTVIYVKKEKQNEEYKKIWMENHGNKITSPKTKEKVNYDEKKRKGRKHIEIDIEKVKNYLAEGYSILEIRKIMNLSNTVIYARLKEANVHIPSIEERVGMFKRKGMSINAITKRVGTLKEVVEGYYKRT